MTYNILLTMLVISIVLWVAFGTFAFIRGMQILRGQKVQETWELWDELPTTLIANGNLYYLVVKKLSTWGTLVQYINDDRAPFILHTVNAETLHEALDKMWLWWQEYEVKE